MEELKTKDDILLNNSDGAIFNDGLVYDGFTDSIYTSMDEYAKQQCIAFAGWISDHRQDYQSSSDPGCWIGLNMQTVSSQMLYDEFIQHSNT